MLSVVCGIYLLGLFRTDHDHDEVKVGPGPARLAVRSFWDWPSSWRRPCSAASPQSLVWDRIIVGILPPDSMSFSRPVQVAGESARSALREEVKATSTDPAEAEREEKRFHGVLWGMSLEQARELAAEQKKPILIDFTGVNCANCRRWNAAFSRDLRSSRSSRSS